MSEITPFTLSFLKLHRQNAASVLERLPVEDTVAFLQEVPIDLAAKTLEVMAPQYVAQCFLIMPSETCSKLMQEMKATTGISLFRFMPSSAKQTILHQLLPDKKALVKRRLSYTQELVGAWMNSDNPPVSPTTLVGEVRKYLRLAKTEVAYAPCVVGKDGKVIGVLSLARLIVAKDSSAVSKIMESDFKVISDRATVKSISSLPHWERFDSLPIANRAGKFIGVLTLKDLNKALSVVKGGVSTEQMDSVLMDGVNAYVSTLSWLIQSVATPSADSYIDSKGGRNGS